MELYNNPMLLLIIVATGHSLWSVTLLGGARVETGQVPSQFVEVVSWQFFLYIGLTLLLYFCMYVFVII